MSAKPDRPTEPVERSISVALCTHNGAEFIVEQVRSVLGQSVPPTQLVLSDDASSDRTVELVRQEVGGFLESNPGSLEFVVVENSVPLGVLRNFEQATSACTGELIALCDQDDLWHPKRLELIVTEFASRPQLTLVFSDARLVDDRGVALGHTLFEAIEFSPSERRRVREGRALDVLLQRNVVTGATTVFRRELLSAALPFPEPWVHDEWLAVIAATIGEVAFLSERLIDYRQHGGNQIGARRPTLKDRLGRLSEPREARNSRLKARARVFAERVNELPGVPDRARVLAEGKRQHEAARSALPRTRVLRILPVLFAAVRGRYRHFGRARFDVLRDLTQPPR